MGGEKSPENEVHVAVATIFDHRGRVLLSRRHPDAHQGGLWEFPGGKVEPGEGTYQALVREVREELGIIVKSARPLIKIPHTYPGRRVLLDVWRVISWSDTSVGEKDRGRENQPLAWVAPQDLQNYRLPAADAPIITAISLPDLYLITPEPDWNAPEAFLDHLDFCLAQGIELVQLRIKSLPAKQGRSVLPGSAVLQDGIRRFPRQETRMDRGQSRGNSVHTNSTEQPCPAKGDRTAVTVHKELAAAALTRCRARGATCLLNAHIDLAREIGTDGVHLSSRVLLAADKDGGINKAPGLLVAASCHNQQEIELAEHLGVDFAVLSPVQATRTHPEAEPMTWKGFAALTQTARIPIYALGGLKPSDLPTAWAHGGQGIAAIRGLWERAGPKNNL